MAGVKIQQFPDPSLDRASRPWTRAVEDRIGELERAAARNGQSETNVNKSQQSTMASLSKNIVDLDARVQLAINSITVNPSQINSGSLPLGVNLNASQITAGTLARPLTTSGDVLAANVTGGNVFAQSVATNITAARVTVWGRTADGFIGTATSSRRAKTDFQVADWPTERLEAIMAMSLTYYRWRASVGLEAYIDGLPEEHPRHGERVPNHLELGFIAEEMHAAGLWEFVVYKRHADDTLVLKNGEPVPFSIHYSMWNLALHAVVQYLWTQRQQDRADIDSILAHLNLAPTAPNGE